MKVDEFIVTAKMECGYLELDLANSSDTKLILKQAIAIIEKQRAALVKIASYREGPVVNGSFDEPGSAEIARKALEE